MSNKVTIELELTVDELETVELMALERGLTVEQLLEEVVEMITIDHS